MRRRHDSRYATTERRRRWIAGLLSVVLAATGVVAGAAPAALAADEYLQIDKSVDKPTPLPGDTFTYSVKVTCSEQDCLDATLSDVLPAQLVGFPIENVTFTPQTIPYTATWSTTGTSVPPATVAAGTGVTVALQQPTSHPVGTGLVAGNTFTMSISLHVPEDHPAGDSGNIVNTATVTATNSAPASDDATIDINVPVNLAVDTTKTWTPNTLNYSPGAASTIALGVGNASNLDATTLVIQEPKAAPAGATALDASNPFTITDFTGFGAASIPPACTSVQTDVYVKTGSTWNWTTGAPGPTLTLPTGVTNADVGGIRVTCTGTLPPGTTVSVPLGLAQRTTDRNSGAALDAATHTVDNTAAGTVTTPSGSATKDASASYTVRPNQPTVTTTKSIDPGTITAGQSAAAQVSAQNGSVPVSQLVIADLDYFTSEITFGGFTAAPDWPDGASAAKVVYHLLAGGTQEVPFADGATPAAPGGAISGFEIVYTGTLITGSATAGAAFTIATSEAATGGASTVTRTNTVASTVTAPNGLTATATDRAPLTILDPEVAVTIDKSVRPSTPVAPGDTVIAGLATVASATGDGAVVHDIVVEDAWDGSTTQFWNAFSLQAIAPTQVPPGASLTIEVKNASGVWQTLVVQPAQSAASVYQLDAAALAAALGALSPALTPDAVQGVRFSFHSDAGFPATTAVTPNLTFAARDTLRTGGSTTPGPDRPTSYTNAATATAGGTTQGGKPLTDTDTDTAPGVIETQTAPPGPGPSIDKSWTKTLLSSQSGEQADTNLRWRTTAGYAPVTITDPVGSWDTPANTVFDAFDLLAIRAIDGGGDPYSNGWYLKYDSVTAVELYYAGAWHTVTPPSGSWMTPARGFTGYSLTAAESAATTAVRITLDETAADSAARVAAQQPGAAFDPYAPLAGSGVGSGSTQRLFALNWQLRDLTRSTGAYVTAKARYNTADPGVIDNTVEVSGLPVGGGTAVTDTDDATIGLIDQPPGVAARKSATPTTQIYTPVVGTPAGSYPTAQWTLSGNNSSTARASAVRLTDPATCAQTTLPACQSSVANAYANPFDTSGAVDYLTNASTPNPFERFTATKLTLAASIPGQVPLSAAVVWLLHYAPATGTYSVSQVTGAAANDLSEAALADVVGVSVTYKGVTSDNVATITQDNLLSVTIDSRLRPTLRSSGADQVLSAGQTVDVVNRVFAQSYDPVLSPDGTPGALTGAVADAKVTLTGGIVDIVPSKSISPNLIPEPAKNTLSTVTLRATQGTATLSPNKVVIEDRVGSEQFWDTFDFVGLGTVTKPAGADRVRIDVYDGTTWVVGTTSATATLPASVPASSIQGIRFTFTKSNGGLFSNTLPAANWTARADFTIKVRATDRSSGEAIVFDHSVTNVQTSQFLRDDGNSTDPEPAQADVTLSPGTHTLAVNKLANDGNRLVAAGVPVPFDLTFQNTGTGYLTVTSLQDQLPVYLDYLATPATTFATSAGGTLSTNVAVALAPDGRTVTFSWPQGGDVMQPGETFTIRLYLELQPGLSQGDRATNTMVAHTAEPLTQCRNTVTGGSTTPDWASDPTTCGTTDYVSVITGSNLYTVKGVRGSLPGAYSPASPTSPIACQQNLVVGSQAYFRTPCVANSEVGGTDHWVLDNVNAGTVPVAEMWVFDQLPTPGDASLISGLSRGSQLRPELVAGSLAVTAPPGTTQTVEVTTSAGVCVGTWAGLTTNPVCEQNGEVWAAAGPSTDWAAVTGIRVHLDFTTTAAGSLSPGQSAYVKYDTLNALASTANPDGASTTVPAQDQLVWNQYGVKYKLTPEPGFRKIAPGAVGSHLRFGSIEVKKVITGPAADYAASSFRVDVACTIDGVALDLGANATVTLDAANALTARIDGIPLSLSGTSCTATEQGAVGEFGETSRTGSPTTLQVTQAAPPDGSASTVPAGQIATITNDYQFTGLSVTKALDTQATEGSFGPFGFTLSCTSITGKAVTFDDAGTTSLEFSLVAGATWTAPADRIPVGATCTLAETDDSAADHIAVTGDNVVDGGDGTATITPGVDAAQVTVTNGYDAGTLTVAKVVTGDGAALYGTGEFSFSAVCTYRGQELLNEQFSLRGGDTRTFGTFPASTSCVVAELTTGGATASSLDPADGTIVIPPPGTPGGVSAATVTATNRFDLASFTVDKERAGNLLNPGAAGPFTVVATCTYDVDGTTTDLDVPGGAERQLTAENGYSTTYADLPVGATCQVTETDSRHAASTRVSVDGGEPVDGTTGTVELGAAGETHVVTITNTFTAGGLSVTKALSGGAASAHGGDVFQVSLACTWYGADVAIQGGAQRNVKAGETVVYTDLPTDALCVLSEPGDGGANGVTMTVDGIFVGSPATFTVHGDATASIVVDNRFEPKLAHTGGDAAPAGLLAGGGVLALLGGVVLLIVRRRRRA